MEGWYRLMSREALDVSMCLDASAGVEGDALVLTFSGAADDDALRATSPLVLTNELELVPLGKAMRGDPPSQPVRAAPA
jgi:hypothetical protein